MFFQAAYNTFLSGRMYFNAIVGGNDDDSGAHWLFHSHFVVLMGILL